MLFNNISLLDENFQIRHNMYLAVNGNKIVYMSEEPPENPAMFGAIYSKSPGKLFIPGFYNAHSHMSMHLLRGYGENLTLHDWLNQKIFPFEDQMTPEDIYWGGLAGAAEMLRFGIVSTTDMYMSGSALGRAFADSGLKANITIGCTCFDQRGYSQLPAYADTMLLLQTLHGYENDRLLVDFSLHGEYTSHEKLVRGVAEAAAAAGRGVHVHVAETASEVAECKARHNGRSPVRYLADCGLFDVPAIAAHCVHIDEEDIAILKEKDVTVATCPKSNLKLASGICPAGKLLQAGVNLAIGTDSVASNNNLNMLEEIKLFALLHKAVNNDPTLITPAQALYAATKAGAISQRREDCGALKPGNRADLVAIDIEKLYWQPAHNLLNNLLYSACGTDVFMTMIDGKIRYEDGEFFDFDQEKAAFEAETAKQRILGAL